MAPDEADRVSEPGEHMETPWRIFALLCDSFMGNERHVLAVRRVCPEPRATVGRSDNELHTLHDRRYSLPQNRHL